MKTRLYISYSTKFLLHHIAYVVICINKNNIHFHRIETSSDERQQIINIGEPVVTESRSKHPPFIVLRVRRLAGLNESDQSVGLGDRSPGVSCSALPPRREKPERSQRVAIDRSTRSHVPPLDVQKLIL